MFTQKKNSDLQEIVSYTPPKLYTGKEWYVGFYAYKPDENRMKIKRIKLNFIQKISERRKYAQDLMIRLSDKLRRGWNPWIESENSKAYTLFNDACESYKTTIGRYLSDDLLREDSYVSYMSYLRNLQKYNNGNKNPITYVYQFDRDYVNEFLEHIYIERENTAQTRDNYLIWLRVFAKYLVKKGYQKTIVTDGIDIFGRRSRKKGRTIIPIEKLKDLKDFICGHNRHYLLATYLLFYCFIRPKELSLLRIQDISIKNRTIFISGDNSKNRKSAVVTLNKKIIELMLDLGVLTLPNDYYLFSNNYMPGKTYRSEKQFRDYWNNHIRKALKFPSEYKFYSLKDTGVTMMLKSRIDNISVRDQARHSSILMTDIYTPHDIQEANPIIEKFDCAF